jgi:hypothetical protein
VNIGFILEKGGQPSPPRLLLYRLDQLVDFGPSDETIFSLVDSLLPKYAPVGDVPQAAYTSLSVPVYKESFAKKLTSEQFTKLDKILSDSCKIDDLMSRLTTGSKNAEQIPIGIDITSLLSAP